MISRRRDAETKTREKEKRDGKEKHTRHTFASDLMNNTNNTKRAPLSRRPGPAHEQKRNTKNGRLTKTPPNTKLKQSLRPKHTHRHTHTHSETHTRHCIYFSHYGGPVFGSETDVTRSRTRAYLCPIDGVRKVPIGRGEQIAAFGHLATRLQQTKGRVKQVDTPETIVNRSVIGGILRLRGAGARFSRRRHSLSLPQSRESGAVPFFGSRDGSPPGAARWSRFIPRGARLKRAT